MLKPRLTGWRKGLYLAGIIAVTLRFLLFLLSHFNGRPVASHASLPAWPLRAGDTIRVLPGDPAIAKWGSDPSHDGFLVQKIVGKGSDPLTPDTVVCALLPEYMADPAQPGGTLTVVAEDVLHGWRVHWVGGDTMPDSVNKRGFNANCGKDAVLLISATQLHTWLNMQSGQPAPAPEPDLPVGKVVPLPQH